MAFTKESLDEKLVELLKEEGVLDALRKAYDRAEAIHAGTMWTYEDGAEANSITFDFEPREDGSVGCTVMAYDDSSKAFYKDLSADDMKKVTDHPPMAGRRETEKIISDDEEFFKAMVDKARKSPDETFSFTFKDKKGVECTLIFDAKGKDLADGMPDVDVYLETEASGRKKLYKGRVDSFIKDMDRKERKAALNKSISGRAAGRSAGRSYARAAETAVRAVRAVSQDVERATGFNR